MKHFPALRKDLQYEQYFQKISSSILVVFFLDKTKFYLSFNCFKKETQVLQQR